MLKRALFYSNVAHEDLRTSNCCLRHKLATKTLLYNIQYYYIVNYCVSQKYPSNALLLFHVQQWLRECATVLLYMYIVCLVKKPYSQGGS